MPKLSAFDIAIFLAVAAIIGGGVFVLTGSDLPDIGGGVVAGDDDSDPFDELFDTPTPAAGALALSDVEASMRLATATVRDRHDAEPLGDIKALSTAARDHSEEMADRGVITTHGAEERFKTAEIGECNDVYVLVGVSHHSSAFDDDPFPFDSADELAVSIVGEWLDTDDHHEALTSDSWRHVGVGAATNEFDEIYVTVLLCRSVLSG